MSATRISRLALVLAGAVAIAGTAVAAPSVQFVSGITTVRLSRPLMNTLTAANVTPEGVLPGILVTTESSARVVLPIPTGEWDSEGPLLEILHSGGLTLTSGDVRVALTSFIIENLDEGTVELTGIVKVNDSILDRVDLFNIELTQAPVLTPAPGGLVTLVDIGAAMLTLTEAGAEALNTAFGLSGVFTQDMPIGAARIIGRVRDRDG